MKILVACLYVIFSLTALTCVIVGLAAWIHPGLGLAAGGLIGLSGAAAVLPPLCEYCFG